MKDVYLISCSKRKQKITCTAEDMYKPSSLYAASLAYAIERVGNKEEQIQILSTKHGLLRLSDVIEPYEKELIGNTESEVKAWTEDVFNHIQHIHDIRNTNFIFLAGANYVNVLSPYLPNYETPLKGMRLEPRTTWLQNHLTCQEISESKCGHKSIGSLSNKHDVNIGQTLWATNGEPVTICEVAEDRICVCYKGQKIWRDTAVVNHRLFLTKDEAVSYQAQGTMEKADSQALQEDSCDNCMLMRREECFGQKNICEDYQHVPYVSKEEMESWPKECMGAYEKK